MKAINLEEIELLSKPRSPTDILVLWRAKYQEERRFEKSCRRHGMREEAMWHEGRADMLEYCANHLEFVILGHQRFVFKLDRPLV